MGHLGTSLCVQGGVRETVHALIWVRRGADLSHERRDVDRERVSVRGNEREERVFIWNGP